MPRLSRIAQASLLALATLSLATAAQAQSNTTATLVVRAAPQAQVLIENLATGLKRRLAVDAEGRVLSGALPPGRYRVSLLRGETVERSTELDLLVGQSGQTPASGFRPFVPDFVAADSQPRTLVPSPSQEI